MQQAKTRNHNVLIISILHFCQKEKLMQPPKRACKSEKKVVVLQQIS